LLQPVRLALALALVWGASPRADAASSRTVRLRPVVVTGNPAEPLPAIRVEAATPTWLFFPTEIAKSTLTVDGQPRTVDKAVSQGDGARIRIVDVGERSIVVQPMGDLRAGERHELAVFFADGRAPARAAFVLVTDPDEMDARIDVERREPPNTTCPADAPPAPPRPEDFVLLGYVGRDGVQTGSVYAASDGTAGLSSRGGVSYRAESWVLVDVRIWNAAGQRPWTPREAMLRGRGGAMLRARIVTEGNGEIAPGGAMRVLAAVAPPPPNTDEVFALDIRGTDGRSLVISRVRFPRQSAEGEQ